MDSHCAGKERDGSNVKDGLYEARTGLQSCFVMVEEDEVYNLKQFLNNAEI